MRVFEGRDEAGKLVYFEVENTLISRRRACRIASSIPRATILKKVHSWFGDDVFCVFQLGERTFEIMEPFGDSSRYHVGEAKVAWSGELEIVKEAFAAYVPFGIRWLRG